MNDPRPPVPNRNPVADFDACSGWPECGCDRHCDVMQTIERRPMRFGPFEAAFAIVLLIALAIGIYTRAQDPAEIPTSGVKEYAIG